MTNVYPTYDEPSSTPVVQETLAVYGNTPHYAPIPHVKDTDKLRQQFETLYNRWIAAPHLLLGYPLSTKWHTYKDYQAIIDMGRDAVPFIIGQIKSRNYMLMHLLPVLSHEDIKINADASEDEIAKAWIQLLN